MYTVRNIHLDSTVPSTCAVMDWLKSNNYPSCDRTEITLSNGQYGGMISDYSPDEVELAHWENIIDCAKEYNGMFRLHDLPFLWKFYMPEVNKYYYLTI